MTRLSQPFDYLRSQLMENVILDQAKLDRTLKRIAHEILEAHSNVEDLVLIGIKTRGIFLANRLSQKIQEIDGNEVALDHLDISFYRDDLTYRYDSQLPKVEKADFTQVLKDKTIILVDDVLYTGRTIRAALDAILTYDRPKRIQLAILVDRGHRELPIRADYVGKNIPTSKEERIAVRLTEVDGEDQVVIIRP